MLKKTGSFRGEMQTDAREKLNCGGNLHILKYRRKTGGTQGMSTRLIIEGNSVYEINEYCLSCGRTVSYMSAGERKSFDKIEHRIPDGSGHTVKGLCGAQDKSGLPENSHRAG